MDRFKLLLMFAFFGVAVSIGYGQEVTITESAKASIPASSRNDLPKRLQAFLRAFNNSDMAELFDLMHTRARRGMSRAEFVHSANAFADAERIFKFQVQEAKQASRSEYSDEPEPRPGEGDKWFISGCARVSIDKSEARNLGQGFDVWLVDGIWYVRRGGLRIDGGYHKCKFK